MLAQAQELLGPSDAAEAPPGTDPARELTPVLTELSRVADGLDRNDRRAARAILARPDDGPGDRYGDGYTAPEASASPDCTANFCVHWVQTTQDKPALDDDDGTTDDDGVPDFVEAVQASAEQSFSVENTSLGWVEPLSDGTTGGGATGKTDAYLVEADSRFFGCASPDEGQGGTTSRAGYLVLDNDYAELAEPGLTPIEAMQVTMAHEYNHVLQFTYDSREDSWMLESTATWNHYLAGTFDANVIRSAWEDSDTVTPPSLSVAAYDSAVGGTGANPFEPLGDQFASFASATAEWRALPALFPDAADYPDVKRQGKLAVDGRGMRLELDHLSYALFKVRPGAAAAEDLTLNVRAPAGTQYAIDLVARSGSPTGGSVAYNTAILDDGGPASATLSADAHSRVSAVITNADASVNASRRYVSDGTRFKLKLVSEP